MLANLNCRLLWQGQLYPVSFPEAVITGQEDLQEDQGDLAVHRQMKAYRLDKALTNRYRTSTETQQKPMKILCW